MAYHVAVKSVPLNGFATSFTNQPHQIRAPHPLRSGRSGVMVDLLFHDCAIDVIRAEAQGDLRDLGASSSASKL